MPINKFSLTAFVSVCLLFSCKETDLEAFTMDIGKITRIELLDETDVTFGSMDTAKIARFVSFLLNGAKDNTGRDFKSNDYIRLYGANGKSIQVEIFKGLFKYGGTVFIAESNVIKKMKAVFDNNPLIETPELNAKQRN
jgi:hypothetical protein